MHQSINCFGFSLAAIVYLRGKMRSERFETLDLDMTMIREGDWLCVLTFPPLHWFLSSASVALVWDGYMRSSDLNVACEIFLCREQLFSFYVRDLAFRYAI